MITCKELAGKTFETKEQMFKSLRENKADIIAQKKMANKETDAFSFMFTQINSKGETIKSDAIDVSNVNTLRVKLVLNTTNIMDSHSDVHIKGIWKKTLQEQKLLYLLQEHKMQFDHIITDNVKAFVETKTWSELGEKYKGDTEALIFEAEISKDRNPYMFEQYAKGYVKNHSVGMRYVKLFLAINSDSKWDVEEKDIWDKYIDEIANKEQADEQGYFWAVTEAKIVEGSAVPLGSNRITPTLETESKEAVKDTSKEIEADKKSLQDKQKQFFNNLI